MSVNILQAFLIGCVYYMGISGTPWLTSNNSMAMMRPMVSGTVVGLILGDPVQGCIIGSAINLPYLAFITAGGTLPMDPGIAGTLGTALGLLSGVSPTAAAALAIPLGLLGTVVWVVHMTVDISFVHMADKAAEEANIDRINFLHVVPPQVFVALITIVPVMVAVYFGADYVTGLVELLDGRPLEILSLIGGILPALGIAMNLKTLNSEGVLVFFILGFMFSMYSGLSILPISVFAAILSYIYTKFTITSNEKEGEVR